MKQTQLPTNTDGSDHIQNSCGKFAYSAKTWDLVSVSRRIDVVYWAKVSIHDNVHLIEISIEFYTWHSDTSTKRYDNAEQCKTWEFLTSKILARSRNFKLYPGIRVSGIHSSLWRSPWCLGVSHAHSNKTFGPGTDQQFNTIIVLLRYHVSS